MAVDPISPIAPARVRVLVLPAGRIKRRRFMTFVERLQHESTVRLGDISPDGRPDRTMFSPMAFPNGALLYHFSAAMLPPSNLALTPFELFREPMMVVGIADAEEYDTKGGQLAKEELERVADDLRDQHPKILVHQLLIMDCSTDHAKDWIPDGAMCVPAQKASRSTTMKTVMCDMSAKFLSELATYAKAVQALPSVQSPGLSTHPAQNLRRPMLDRSSSIDSRSDSPAPGIKSPPLDTLSRTNSPAQGSVPGDVSAASPQTTNPPTSFDQIASAAMAENSLTRTVSRTERDGSRTASKDRMSMQAFGSSNAAEKARTKGKARVGIVIGNLYMMAGRWSDAWRELVENTNKSRIASDYLWYAKGLESIMVCMLLFVWTGYDFHIPAICYTGTERTSSTMIPNGVKDGLPSLGSQDPVAAQDAARRLAKLLPDLVMTIMGIHDRANTLGGETLPPVAHSESVIRMAKLLAMLQNANGQLESGIVGKMTTGRPSTSSSIPNTGYTAGISKHAIADILFRAYPPTSVPLSDATKMLSGIASVLAILGLERKKAIVVKELVASLVPVLVQARKVGAAEMGIHPAASLSAAFDIPASDQQGGLDTLLEAIHTVYGAQDKDRQHATHDKTASHVNGDDSTEALINATVGAATAFADAQAFGSLHLKIDVLRACIDFCEALPDLPGIVHFAALLLRITGPQSAVSPSMPSGRVKLSMDEQMRLISNMSRTSNAANKIGLNDIQVPYWDDFLVRSIQWFETDAGNKLREHQKADIDVESHSKKRSPFLYDPFAKQDKKAAEKVLVAGEYAELIVTLQNPYDFEIKVERLSLVTEGVELDSNNSPCTLGPARLQNVPITVRARGVGKLKIIGCSVKILGCREQVFPIYVDSWSAAESIKVKQVGLPAVSDAKPTSISPVTKGQAAALPVPQSLSSTVIQAQPHVIVESTSLSEAALMALEGQRKTFQVTLRNTSSTTSVDFLHVSFEDSLTTSIRSALSSKDLSRAEMYEFELQLAQDPIFTWVRSDSSSSEVIAPGASATFDITVVGRPGLGAAKVMFDYAYLGQAVSEVQGSTYTRQAVVPVDITVNASVQLHRIDFAEFPTDFAWSNQHRERSEVNSRKRMSRRSSSRPAEKSTDRFRTLLDRVGTSSSSGDEEHCLVLLDLRNAWPNPLTVSIEVREGLGSSTLSPGKSENNGESGALDDWKRAYSVHEVIHPGHIARLVLLLPKLQIMNPHAPIPLLSQNQRQYVVNADKVFSQDVEMTLREQFWFRDEVLKHIRGSWKEDGSARQGSIDLRGIRLSPRMIDMMRLQDVDIRMTVVTATTTHSPSHNDTAAISDSISEMDRLGRSTFQVFPEVFLSLQVKITNRSTIPIRGLLRLQPTLAHQTSPDLALDIGRKLMVSGLLQQAMPTLEPSQTVTMEVGLCPLVSGEFDIHALVEELVIPQVEHIDLSGNVAQGDFGAGREDFSASGQGLKPRERRIWRAGEACRLVVE